MISHESFKTRFAFSIAGPNPFPDSVLFIAILMTKRNVRVYSKDEDMYMLGIVW